MRLVFVVVVNGKITWPIYTDHFFFFLRRDLPQKRIDQRRSGKNFSGDIFSGEFTSYTI